MKSNHLLIIAKPVAIIDAENIPHTVNSRPEISILYNYATCRLTGVFADWHRVRGIIPENSYLVILPPWPSD